MSHNTPPFSNESMILPRRGSSGARTVRLLANKSRAGRFVPGVAAAMILAMTGGAALAQQKKPPAAPKRTSASVARDIAYLMRVADHACMGVSFDPTPLSRLIDRKGMTPLQVRAKFREDFQKSYDEAGARIAADGIGGYCDVVINEFAKRPKDYPGLAVR